MLAAAQGTSQNNAACAGLRGSPARAGLLDVHHDSETESQQSAQKHVLTLQNQIGVRQPQEQRTLKTNPAEANPSQLATGHLTLASSLSWSLRPPGHH